MIIDNQCKNCGGELSFDPASQELKCNQCLSIVDIPEQDAISQKKPFNELSSITTSKTKYAQYSCQSCGRKHIANLSQTVNNCPSCGSGDISRTVNVDYIPDGIIPFKLNQEMAIKSFKEWLNKRKFAPNNLKKLAKQNDIKGIYIPMYNFDFETFTTYSGVGIREHRHDDGRVHTTKHKFNGNRQDTFYNISESANSIIPTYFLKDISNYDFSKIYVYRTEFLYGFFANNVNINLQQSFCNAKIAVENEIKSSIKHRENYDRIESLVCNTTYNKMLYNFLYVPVWTFNYSYNNKNYNCYINGVTGKVSGKAPKSFAKIFFTVLGIIAAVVGAGILFSQYLS